MFHQNANKQQWGKEMQTRNQLTSGVDQRWEEMDEGGEMGKKR